MADNVDETRLDSALSAVLVRELPDFEALLSCNQLSAGASQETYCITYRAASKEARLALRRTQPTATGSSSVGGITLATEAQLFKLALAGGVPGPEVLFTLRESDGLGDGFIMRWLEGETLGHRIVREETLGAVRPTLAHQCGQILGNLHQLTLDGTDLASALPQVQPAQLIDETWRTYRDLNVPVPMLDYTWRWLRDNLPDSTRTTLVHGDFRNGNLMVTPQGINAVLDWELAHIGDPIRDLGWLCVNSWRFGRTALPVGGFGKIEDLLAGYKETTGVDVQLSDIVFWQVFGSFWWGMATLQMANAWRTGDTPSLERPVIGRRSSEAQMDCVNLLLPGELTLPKQQADASAGAQLPMPAELLQGVRAFLQDTITQKVDPHTGFLARVAANSLGIAQREFAFGEQFARQEHLRLQDLLGSSDDLDTLRWALVNALRADLPLHTPGLAAHLRQTVGCQLFIDQPRYSALTSCASPSY